MPKTPPSELDPLVKRQCSDAEARGGLVTVRWLDSELKGEHSVVLQCTCDPSSVAQAFRASGAVRLSHDGISCSVCTQRSQVTEARWHFRNPLLLNFVVSRPGDRESVATAVTTHPGVECVYEG